MAVARCGDGTTTTFELMLLFLQKWASSVLGGAAFVALPWAPVAVMLPPAMNVWNEVFPGLAADKPAAVVAPLSTVEDDDAAKMELNSWAPLLPCM